jgi:hypothetical protein
MTNNPATPAPSPFERSDPARYGPNTRQIVTILQTCSSRTLAQTKSRLGAVGVGADGVWADPDLERNLSAAHDVASEVVFVEHGLELVERLLYATYTITAGYGAIGDGTQDDDNDIATMRTLADAAYWAILVLLAGDKLDPVHGEFLTAPWVTLAGDVTAPAVSGRQVLRLAGSTAGEPLGRKRPR